MVRSNQSKGGWEIMQKTIATEHLCSQKKAIHFETVQDIEDMPSVENIMRKYDVFVNGSELRTSMMESITSFILVICKSNEFIKTTTKIQRSIPRTTVMFSVDELKETKSNKNIGFKDIVTRLGSHISNPPTHILRKPFSSSAFNILRLGNLVSSSKSTTNKKQHVFLKNPTPIIVKNDISTSFVVESVVCRQIPKIVIITPSKSFSKSLCCSLNIELNKLTDDTKKEMKFGVFPEGRMNLNEFPYNDIRRFVGLFDCSCCLLNPLAPGPPTLTILFNFTSLIECEWLKCSGTMRKIIVNQFEDLICTSNKVIVTDTNFGCEKLNNLTSMMRGVSRPVYVSKGLYE